MSVKKVELLSEDHVNLHSGDVLQFSMTSGQLHEIYCFVKERLLESIKLEQFLNEREIEFLQKYIACLNDMNNCNFNNQNELEHLSHLEKLTPSEKEKALEKAQNRLNTLQQMSVTEKEEKISNVFSSSQLEELKIMKPSERCLLKNISFESEILRKIEKILEKLSKVEKGLEALFWFSEVSNLLEQLEEEQRDETLSLIVDTVFNSSESSRSIYSTLIVSLIDKEIFTERIYMEIGKMCSVETLDSNQRLTNVQVFSELVENTHLRDSNLHERFLMQLIEETVKVLENVELNGGHLEMIISIFEKISLKFEGMTEKFQTIFELIDTNIGLLDEFQRSRANLLKTPAKKSSVTNNTSNNSTSSSEVKNTTSSNFSNSTSVVCNVTVAVPTENETKKYEELKKEFERLKIEMTENENRRRQEEEDKNRRREEKEEEEERRKRRLENEEVKRREELQRRNEEEARNRQKEENRRREAEKEAVHVQQEKERLKCTFLSNISITWNQDDKQYSSSFLDGKVIGLYFSGSWCPPSLTFTPILSNFHSQVKDSFEVVFISCDNSYNEMMSYLETHHGNWFYLPFKSVNGEQLKTSLQLDGIPKLAIVRPNGRVITMNGREAVQDCTNPRKLVNSWKALL